MATPPYFQPVLESLVSGSALDQPMKVIVGGRHAPQEPNLSGQLQQSAEQLRSALDHWETCLQGALVNQTPNASATPNLCSPPGLHSQPQLLAEPNGIGGLQSLLCQVASSLQPAEASVVCRLLADTLAAVILRDANSPASQAQPLPDAALQQLMQQLLECQQSAQQNQLLTDTMVDNAHGVAAHVAANAAAAWQYQQQASAPHTPGLLDPTWNSTRLGDTAFGMPSPMYTGHGNSHAHPQAPTVGRTSGAPLGKESENQRRGKNGTSKKDAGRKGSKEVPSGGKGKSNNSQGKAKAKGSTNQRTQEAVPVEVSSVSLRSNLEDLRSVECNLVIIARKINVLGFGSSQLLERHFSQYGKVDRVLVAHGLAKSRSIQYRPSGLGFVVMSKAEEVQAILADGPEQQVCKNMPESGGAQEVVSINVQAFKHDIGEGAPELCAEIRAKDSSRKAKA